MHTRGVIVCAWALLTALPSCIQADDGLIPIHLPGGVIIQAEIANTMKKRAEGLMYREYLAKDRGMLFTFDQAQPWTFWMKNTPIPLDMIFINRDLKIVGIVEQTVPFSLDSRSVDAPSQYVLEINGGLARRHGIQTGDRVRFDSFSPQGGQK